MLQEAREATGSPEITETLAGVGALIITPDGFFLSIEEGRTSRRTGKIKGMRSLPMETIEAAETHDQALKRLLREEVSLEELKSVEELNDCTNLTRLCRVQLTPGIWLHAYLIPINYRLQAKDGTHKDALNPKWVHISEVLKSDLKNREFRPGTREVIKSYLRFQRDTNSQPELYFRCEDEIPQEVFDELERQTKQA